MILLEFIYLFPDVQMTRRFKVFTLLLALFSNIGPIIDVCVCVAPDRLALCNSPFQFFCLKKISPICLINQYVKNRKSWGNSYAHHHWALKSSISFYLHFPVYTVEQHGSNKQRFVATELVPLYNITHIVNQRNIVPLLWSWHWNDIVILAICLPPLDIDECTVVNGGCQQSCINTPGTFHCECDTGYRLHADERTCISE